MRRVTVGTLQSVMFRAAYLHTLLQLAVEERASHTEQGAGERGKQEEYRRGEKERRGGEGREERSKRRR